MVNIVFLKLSFFFFIFPNSSSREENRLLKEFANVESAEMQLQGTPLRRYRSYIRLPVEIIWSGCPERPAGILFHQRLMEASHSNVLKAVEN